jgi:hypothetical protein
MDTTAIPAAIDVPAHDAVHTAIPISAATTPTTTPIDTTHTTKENIMTGTTTTTGTGGTPNIFHHSSTAPSMAGMLPFMGGGYGGAGAGAGAGLGAGLLGGVLAGALFNGGGFGGIGGNRGGGDFVTQASLQAALNGQTANSNSNAILQNLATIQAEIPASECRVQLAVAASQNAIQAQHTTQSLAAASLAAGTNGLISATGADITNQIRNNTDALASQLNSLQIQGAQQTFALNSAIRDDGDKTRSLINSINDATLNRIITNQANEIIELKGDKNFASSGLNITQTVNQAQAQAQQQQQQQQILFTLGQIIPVLGNLQNAVATNSNMIIGNTGASTTGAQTANPVNVKG